jgi:hypothetical protein
MDAADEGEFDSQNLGIVFTVLLAVIGAFDRVSGMPENVPSMEHVLTEMTGAPLPELHRLSPCPCGSGRRYRECCLKKRALRAPLS